MVARACGRVENIDGGKLFARSVLHDAIAITVVVTSGLQLGTRAHGIKADSFDQRIVGNRTRRNQRARHSLAQTGHAIDELLLVDGEREGAAHACIVKRVGVSAGQRGAAIEAEEVGAESVEAAHIAPLARRRDGKSANDVVSNGAMCETSVDFRGKTREIRLSLRKHFGLVLRAEISEPIAAARLKAQHARVRVLDGAAFHRLGDDATWGPVVRIGLEAHVALVTPHRWHIGAIGHDATRLGPVVALDESAACVVEGNELLDGCRMHGREARKRAKIEEISQRRVEMHDEGVRVRRFDGDVLGEIRLGHAPKFSRIAVIGFGRFGIRRQRSRAVVVERARAADGEVKRGVVGSGIGQNRAAPRVGEVRARHGITVGPPGIRAQMKGVGAQISGDFPPFCHAFHNRTVAGAQIHQCLVDHARAAQLMLVTHALRVERVAVRSLDQHQIRRRQR